MPQKETDQQDDKRDQKPHDSESYKNHEQHANCHPE